MILEADMSTSVNELIYLSKFFGQSVLDVQGQGGNISVKHNDMMFIKCSGAVLGDISLKEGYCIVNYLTRELLQGNKPSMEIDFHCNLKKYTVHLHFIPANIYLCSNSAEVHFKSLKKRFLLIDYIEPGEELANKIREKYNNEPLILLKNHGIIITADTIDEIHKTYNELFDFCNQTGRYSNEIDCKTIHLSIRDRFEKSVICREYTGNFDNFKEIKYCFPDIAVYAQNIIHVHSLDEITRFEKVPDIILYNRRIFIITENLRKYYLITEILQAYEQIVTDCSNLQLLNVTTLTNMEAEKYRKNL